MYCHGAKFVINSSFAKLLDGRRISEKVCKVVIYRTYAIKSFLDTAKYFQNRYTIARIRVCL